MTQILSSLGADAPDAAVIRLDATEILLRV